MERQRDFQIHDGRIGRALYTTATSLDALSDYFAALRKHEVTRLATVGEDGVARVTVDGVTYEARPVNEPVEAAS